MSDTSNLSSRLYRRVADELAASIRSGKFASGDKLPSERDLAEHFGVSRPTIREAMIALEIYGVVEIRPGSGNYVADGSGANDGEVQDLDVGAFELIEARIIIESGAAGVAAAVISDADLEYLESLVGQMRGHDEHTLEKADQQFHLHVAQVTNNGPLINIIKELWELRTSSLLASSIMQRAKGGGLAARVREHEHILAALKSRDPVAARLAMQEHLEKVREYLLEATETEELESLRRKHKAARAALSKRTVRV